MYNKTELEPDQRMITVSYSDMETLMNRSQYIREKLLKDLSEKDEFTITSEYISQDENKYYLNFILTPKYRV